VTTPLFVPEKLMVAPEPLVGAGGDVAVAGSFFTAPWTTYPHQIKPDAPATLPINLKVKFLASNDASSVANQAVAARPIAAELKNR
jgi:hypothetical protein